MARPPPPPTWPAARAAVPTWSGTGPPRHLHIVPSLSLGGAERIALAVAMTLASGGAAVDLAVMRHAEAEYRIHAPGVAVHRLGGLSWPERIACAAGLALASGLPAFCHLTSGDELRKLWAFGVRTVPVVHNAGAGWKEDPRAWDVDAVPFVAACGERVAAELRAAGLRKPVRVLRHVVAQPAPMPSARRMAVRGAMGARPGTLLVGMAGRHVPQKRYGKAVDVLARLVWTGVDARLVIVGAATGTEGTRCRAEITALAVRPCERAGPAAPGAFPSHPPPSRTTIRRASRTAPEPLAPPSWSSQARPSKREAC